MTWIAELENLTLLFGKRVVLDGISLKIEEGQILGLLGPNGSGKTTLLKVLAFLLKPTKGKVIFQREEVGNKNLERLRLQSALVHQRTLLFSTSVFNNVAYGLRMRKIPKVMIKEQVKDALKLVKLEDFENRNAKKLSGGEQQRLALARALVLKTKLLLLDEPTANLDPKNASIIEDIIVAANKELKTTIVMATHNMLEAKKLPNRIALIDHGHITEVKSAENIFRKLSRNLASFAAVENTFKGTARLTDAGMAIVDIGNGTLIETTLSKQGSVSIFINPQDIILSKKPLESSARNVLKGKITQISDSDSVVKLTVDVGKPFVVQITKRSFSDMSLNLGTEVFTTFKASSVQEI
jgi:molybdopterin-binding protein